MCFQDGSPIKKSDRLITNLDPPAVVEEPATPETNPVEEEPENEPNGDVPSAPEGDFLFLLQGFLERHVELAPRIFPYQFPTTRLFQNF